MSVGFVMRSSVVIAWTFAPAVAPLCAIGVAIEIAFAQLWPGSPGMLPGKRSVTVGTFHDTSPMSSEPPPRKLRRKRRWREARRLPHRAPPADHAAAETARRLAELR